MKNTPALIFGFALAIALAPATRAAERFWGGGSGNITDNNWYSDLGLTTPAARGNGDVANIASGTVFVTGNATVYDTNIGLAAGDNAAVIVSGNWYNSGGELSIGGVGGTNAIFPAPTGGAGGLTILSSGSVRASTFYVGGYGSGTFHLAQGAKLTNHANAFLGRNAGGSGTATIDGLWTIKGSSTNNGNLSIAHAVGSRGNLLTIGVTGTVIANANTASTNYFYIGPNRSTSGTVIVNGLLRIDGTNAINSIAYRGNNGTASDTAASGVLIIGQTGTVIFSGTETSLGHLGIGSGTNYRANSTGTAFVDGTWKNAGNLIIGRSGAGHLEIGQTGTVTVGTFGVMGLYNSAANEKYSAAANEPVGGTAIVKGTLDIAAYFMLGAAAPATLSVSESGALMIGDSLYFGSNNTRLNVASNGDVLIGGNYYQTAQSTLAITPGLTRDSPFVTIAAAASLSGTLNVTGLENMDGAASAASVTKSSDLPGVTVLRAADGISGDFTSVNTGTLAFSGTAGLPDYIFHGKSIIDGAEYRIGHILSWHAPAASAHGAFTIGAGATLTLDTPLADRVDASALATGWDGKSLAKRGPGTLILADAGSRTGDTTIESGTLRVATPAVSLGNLVNNAVLDLGGSSGGHHTATADTLAGTGTFILAIDSATGKGDRLIITGSASGAHTVRVSIDGAMPTTPTPAQLAATITVQGDNNATFNAATPPAPAVTFAPQGGTVSPASKTISPGAAYGVLPTPAHDSAKVTFAGWWTEPNAGTQVTDATIVAAGATNHLLYARWTTAHPSITPEAGNNLYGSIIDDTGAPVPGVVVTDGFKCVVTNASGIYQMKRHAKARAVYYSTPAAYAINTRGASGKPGLANFHTKLTPARQRYDFELVRLPAPEKEFILVPVGDPQVTNAAQLQRYKNETVADLARFAASSTLPAYAILLGDICNDTLHMHAPIRDTTNLAGIPYFGVIGNHDHNQAITGVANDFEAGADYENVYGPPNYSFDRGDVHIIGLDSILYNTRSTYSKGITDEIYEWITQDLSHVPKNKMIVLAYHSPMGNGSSKNWQKVLTLLKGYAGAHLMAGHTHTHENVIINPNPLIYEHIHGTACGAWWNSILNTDGAPNGYGVFTFSGNKVADWYFKPTSYSDTYQMRMYRGDVSFGGASGTYSYNQPGYATLGANDVVVDAWNADDNWKFEVYENGAKVSGSLKKLNTLVDAYANGYHIGVRGSTSTSFGSRNNKHLYSHTLKTAGARVEIRATDRFGKTYSLSDFTTDLSEFPANFASPEITAQPSDATVTAGNPATFTAVVSGTPKPSLKWQSSSDGATWTDISGATTASHTIPNATTAQNGTLYRLAATNARGLATSHAGLLTVNPNLALDAAQTLKAQLQATGTATITVSGTVDLSLVGGATVAKGKTIVGADATSTISGNLTLAAGASDTIIRGVNFTTGALTINGANDVDVSHCTFTDAPVSITGNADNIAFSWNIFTATPAGTGSAMTISNAGASTGILLDHNLWGANLKNNMPGATNARVYMYNNYITATGNTTATIAGAGAQILSVRNIYQGVKNPLTKQSSGRLRTIDNIMDATTGTTATGDDKVFVPGYAHIIDSGDSNTAAAITANAGNTAGKNSATPAQTNGAASISATVTGSGANKTASSASVPHAGGFTLTGNATGFTPTARQWYRDNTAIVGATSATYAVTSATAAAHAGAYAVALTTSTGEIVTSGAFTVTVAAPPIDTPDTGNSSGGGGGGGAPSLLLLPALLLLLAGRTLRLSRKR
ncbi:T5SS/PEP-CTERM-associated repeat protein/autotransporter-associated beta strand protein [Ereboglobus sp. PH5-10]|uniref:calcineurin-like phosphoesterase C-terminal domain-containing protein n=1 Tax=Ereboglobus sp. PH5-10 TaxID=2940629 RepID=UPI002405E0ED|nr:calcineurin-like phosphoesterase C-terminal domain-containing protein [Ereboglobus sp. PH5-10]MDF9826980.1 T5SS/PEP-CTERM-associated repeat protein/autotransporter-associated beta strand protein [Ereboglobus sp. PH5-10]